MSIIIRHYDISDEVLFRQFEINPFFSKNYHSVPVLALVLATEGGGLCRSAAARTVTRLKEGISRTALSVG